MSAPIKKANRQIYAPGTGITVNRDGSLQSVNDQVMDEASEENVEPALSFEILTNQLNGVSPDMRDQLANALKLIETELNASEPADVSLVHDNLNTLRAAPPKVRTDLKALIETTPDVSQPIKIMARQLLR